MPVMLRNISAPQPAEQIGAAASRSGNSRPDRDRNSSSDFSHALRGAQDDDPRNAGGGLPTNAQSARPAKGSDRQDRKTDVAKKRPSKDEDTDEQNANATAPAAPVIQRNDAPLAALLNFVSYRVPSEEKQTAAQTDVPVELTAPAENPQLSAGSTSIDTQTAAAKTGDVKAAAATNGRTQDRGQSMTVPFDSYPILLAGNAWSTTTSATAASAPNGNAASTSAVSNVVAAAASSSPSDPLVVNAPPASEAVEPALTPKNTAFAIRLSPDAQQPAKAADATPAQKFSIAGPSIAAFEQASTGDGKSQSNDTSSGHNSSFGMAYSQPAVELRPTMDKPTFSEAANTAKATGADEIAVNKPATSDPLRNILLQLKGDDNRRIDVRLVERAGELHVAVKSADPVLAERLQQNMPELTSRLESEHFTHEVWMPKLSESQRSESRSNSDSTSAGSDGQSGQSFNGDAGRRQQGQSQSRPDWVDLLENQIG